MKHIKIFISSVQSEFAQEREMLCQYIRTDALLGKFFEPFIFEEVPANEYSATHVFHQEEDFRVVIWRNKSETDPNVIQIDPNGDPNVIQIVGLIQNNPKISRAELAERLQISERKTRMCIEQLKKEGILIREGSTKRGKWIVIGN